MRRGRVGRLDFGNGDWQTARIVGLINVSYHVVCVACSLRCLDGVLIMM